MPPFGLCGQSYTTQSPIAASQKTQGWYPEFIDDPVEERRIVLNPTPGLSLFASIGTGPHRGQLQCLDGQLYTVSGNRVYATTAAGVITNIGPISSVNNN